MFQQKKQQCKVLRPGDAEHSQEFKRAGLEEDSQTAPLDRRKKSLRMGGDATGSQKLLLGARHFSKVLYVLIHLILQQLMR